MKELKNSERSLPSDYGILDRKRSRRHRRVAIQNALDVSKAKHPARARRVLGQQASVDTSNNRQLDG